MFLEKAFARSVVLSVMSVCAQCLCAADCTWRGFDGFWKTNNNWVEGIEPVVDGYTAIFPEGNYKVSVDNHTKALYSLILTPGYSGGTVVFSDTDLHYINIAEGTDNANHTGFAVGEGRNVKIDGVYLYLNRYTDIELGVNSKMDIESGIVHVRSGNITVNTNAVLNITGGSLQYRDDSQYLKLAKNATVNFRGGSNIIGRIVNKVSYNKGNLVSEFDGDGSKITFSGGYSDFPEQYAFSSYVDQAKTEFKLTGGILKLYMRIVRGIRSLLPGKGAEMHNIAPGLVMTDEYGGDDLWELGGKVFFTTEGSYVNLGWGVDTKIQGGGEISACTLKAGANNSYVDLGRVNVASNFYSSSNGGSLYFQDGITFGAYGDVSVYPHKSARFVPCGRLRFDTVDVVDRVTRRSFDLSTRFDLSNLTSFEVEGAGAVAVSPEVALKYLHNFSADAGSTVALTNSKSSIKALNFSLGADSLLLVGSNVVDVAGQAQLGEGAEIRFSFDTLEPGKMYPLWFGPHGTTPPVGNFGFSTALPDRWTVAINGSVAYLWDGTAVGPDSSNTNYWQGVTGGNWNVAGNWGDGIIPGNNVSYYAYFSGNNQLSVTNDHDEAICWVRSFASRESSGPYIISGKPLAANYPTSWQKAVSVVNGSKFPFTIESMLSRYRRAADSLESFFAVQANSDAPIVLTGGGNFTNAVFRFRGDVHVGGDWVTLGLYPASGGGRDTRLVLLPGAYLETLEQGSNQTVSATYNISAGSGMTVDGDVWRWTTTENVHFIDGVVTSACPVQATARQTFIGDGVLSLSSVQADAEGPGSLKFSENITVRPGGWKTVHADADNAMQMIVRDNVTIGAWGDWTYGPEAGCESATDSSDRALKVIGGTATRVKFDTEGRTVTLADPLVVEKWSTVVKQGEGALVLGSDENSLADSEFELLGGELKLGVPQTFGTLTFDGGSITLTEDFAAGADTFVEIFTAKKVVGEVAISGRYRIKSVSDEDGVSVSVRRERGTAVILR